MLRAEMSYHLRFDIVVTQLQVHKEQQIYAQELAYKMLLWFVNCSFKTRTGSVSASEQKASRE
jgi:hypothetical protein